MTAMIPASVLALPALAPEVPAQYTVPGADSLTVPLTIALLEAGVISDAMLRAPRNALLMDVFGEQEKQLCERALAYWWTRIIRETPCKFFRWKLHVQQLNSPVCGYDEPNTAWFCFTRIDGEIPRFALAHGIEQLEQLREGFGQTVLAVLRDTTQLLPDSFTPWQALGYAEYMYWGDSVDDVDLLEQRREMGDYATVADLVEHEHIVTRAMFFAELPEWVCTPKRVLSRDQIEEAAASEFARRVVDLCDQLHSLVNKPDFILRPSHKGAYRCGEDSIDASMVLLWKQYDVVGQAIDDYLEDLGNSGNGCEFIDANPVPMTAAGVREFMTTTEQCLQIAVLAEKLILLLGEKF